MCTAPFQTTSYLKWNRVIQRTKQRIRMQYQNYIDLTNKKGAIFRDIFIERYDPNVLNRHTIKAKPKEFDDPTDRVIRRRKDELSMMSEVDSKRRSDGGRETLDVQSWHTARLRAHPHGFAARSAWHQLPSVICRRNSRDLVVMDQFNILTGDLGGQNLWRSLVQGRRCLGSVPTISYGKSLLL